ncbi:unnamed protein product [Acanthosepion pharaonis]|uniref:Uncharacterized protein n=1 Tax=Acanthosepion pharaonis TaxID=158019 RepID=A0A812EML5_ACAPH|nr:unnamed protein product [Sepia pharaonis]
MPIHCPSIRYYAHPVLSVSSQPLCPSIAFVSSHNHYAHPLLRSPTIMPIHCLLHNHYAIQCLRTTISPSIRCSHNHYAHPVPSLVHTTIMPIHAFPQPLCPSVPSLVPRTTIMPIHCFVSSHNHYAHPLPSLVHTTIMPIQCPSLVLFIAFVRTTIIACCPSIQCLLPTTIMLHRCLRWFGQPLYPSSAFVSLHCLSSHNHYAHPVPSLVRTTMPIHVPIHCLLHNHYAHPVPSLVHTSCPSIANHYAHPLPSLVHNHYAHPLPSSHNHYAHPLPSFTRPFAHPFARWFTQPLCPSIAFVSSQPLCPSIAFVSSQPLCLQFIAHPFVSSHNHYAHSLPSLVHNHYSVPSLFAQPLCPSIAFVSSQPLCPSIAFVSSHNHYAHPLPSLVRTTIMPPLPSLLPILR